MIIVVQTGVQEKNGSLATGESKIVNAAIKPKVAPAEGPITAAPITIGTRIRLIDVPNSWTLFAIVCSGIISAASTAHKTKFFVDIDLLFINKTSLAAAPYGCNAVNFLYKEAVILLYYLINNPENNIIKGIVTMENKVDNATSSEA